MPSGSFEQIIRPFGQPDIRPKPTVLQFAPPEPEEANTFVWGSAGASAFRLKAHVKQDVKPAEWPETQRTYDVVRVKNPDDPDQHVDMEVMTEFQSRNKIDQSRFKLRFEKTKPSANVEILTRDNVRKSEGT